MFFIKKNLAYLIVALVSLLLGVMTMFIVTKISREEPVAPTAPTKQKALEGEPVSACRVSVTLNLVSPSPSDNISSPSLYPSSSPSSTPFVSPSPSATLLPSSSPLPSSSIIPSPTPGVSPSGLANVTPTPTPIGGLPSVLVTKTVNTTSAKVNDVLTYTVRITNTSNYPAYDTYFDENLSDNVDYIAPSLSCTRTDVSSNSTTGVGFEIDNLSDGFDTTPDGESSILDNFRVAGDLTENNNTWDLDLNDFITCTYRVKVNSNVVNGSVINNSVIGHVDDKNGDQPNETDITGTVTTTVVIAVSPTPTPPAACNQICSTSNPCPNNLICYIVPGQTSGYCRVPACPTDADCVCPQATPSPAGYAALPTPTPSLIPQVPRAGTSLPTVLLLALGSLLILGGVSFVYRKQYLN